MGRSIEHWPKRCRLKPRLVISTLLTFKLIIKTRTVAKHDLTKQKTIGNQTKQNIKQKGAENFIIYRIQFGL